MEMERLGKYLVHPVAALFPLMEGEPFDDLVEDIELQGQRVPIVVHEGVLLDGRNRLRACLKLNREPAVTQYVPELNVDPGVWILSMNIQRRNLTDDQRTMIWTKSADVIREMNREKQLAASVDGAKGGRGHSKPLPPNDGKGLGSPTRNRHARSTAGQVAAAVGVSERKASQAIAVKDHAPDLAEQVIRGKTKLKDASKIARHRKATKKPETAKRVKRSKPPDLEKGLRRAVAAFEHIRDSYPEELRARFTREFLSTVGKL